MRCVTRRIATIRSITGGSVVPISQAVSPTKCWLASSTSSIRGSSSSSSATPRYPSLVPPAASTRVIGGDDRRRGSVYIITDEEKRRYATDGFLVLDGVVSEEELLPIEHIVNQFIYGNIPVPGKDYCDMSKGLDAKPEDFNLVNAMLPRVYQPSFAGNIFEKRCESISKQLLGQDLSLDFDQILAKKPTKKDAVFAWHQDLAYWPLTPDTRTATISLALDDATIENGCIRFVVGSQREAQLRRHYPLISNKDGRDASHTLVTDVPQHGDKIAYAPVKRGGVSVHDERIVHGSGGNQSNGWRRTYIVVHRAAATVKWEREQGFTHSHNDTFNWDAFNKWGKDPK